MKKNIDYIMRQYDKLTQSEKKLAEYIYQHQDEVQYMSIVSLAKACDVGEATITRFCRKLDFSGYNELKLALARDSSISQEDELVSLESDLISPKDMDPFLYKANQLYKFNLMSMKETFLALDDGNIQKAVGYISKANHVYCMGQGASMVIAMEAWARFSVVTTKFVWVPDSHMQAMTASLSDSSDVILLFSYSGATRDGISLLNIAKEKKARIILVTHYPDSPAAEYADIILICGSKEGPLQMGSVAAKIGQLYLIDILYNEYCNKNEAETTDNRTLASHAISKKLL